MFPHDRNRNVGLKVNVLPTQTTRKLVIFFEYTVCVFGLQIFLLGLGIFEVKVRVRGQGSARLTTKTKPLKKNPKKKNPKKKKP